MPGTECSKDARSASDAPRASRLSPSIPERNAARPAFQVAEQVRDVLDADRQTDQTVVDALVGALRGGLAGVRRRRGVQDQRADVAQVGHPAEQLDAVDEGVRGGFAARQREREDGAGSARQVALGEVVERTGGQTRVVDARHLRLCFQPLRHRQRVRAVAFHAQAQRLDALADQERVERRRGGADARGDDVTREDDERPVAVTLDVAVAAE
ncbi:hypothetical protein QP157_12405 [Sphingomonas sp. LR61]